mmetsp:Transcript_91835/g.260006  ORF Transcript_91835/g.260006 Transcript_91835/m.260006 type:complete len:210 (+) Transcript_91835:82-711(+)
MPRPRPEAALLLLLSAALPAFGKEGAPVSEGRSPDELRAILKGRGVECRGCTSEEEFAARVSETQGWRADEAVSPDGKVRVTKDVFRSKYWTRPSQHVGHELDDSEGDDESSGFLLGWEHFREGVRAGDFTSDGRGGFRRKTPEAGQIGWRVHAKWLLAALLAWCALRRRIVAATAPAPATRERPPPKKDGGGGGKPRAKGKASGKKQR